MRKRQTETDTETKKLYVQIIECASKQCKTTKKFKPTHFKLKIENGKMSSVH